VYAAAPPSMSGNASTMAAEEEPNMTPGAPMSAPQAASVLHTFGAAPQERSDAIKNLAWRVAENRLFVDSVGGDANAADLLRRLAPTAAGARQSASALSAESRLALEKKTSPVGYGNFRIAAPGAEGGGIIGSLFRGGAPSDFEVEKARWSFGDQKNLANINDRELVTAMTLAEAARQGKFSEEEASAAAAGTSPNTLKAYSMLTTDDKMAKRIIPAEIAKAVREQVLSEAEQRAKGMTPEDRKRYEELRAARAAAGGR